MIVIMRNTPDRPDELYRTDVVKPLATLPGIDRDRVEAAVDDANPYDSYATKCMLAARYQLMNRRATYCNQ